MLRSVLLGGAIGFGTVASFAHPAAAQTPGLQISVEPLVVQFSIAPGGQASTHVVVRNVGTASAVVVANPFDWNSTVDGTVRTERPTGRATSLVPYLRLSGSTFSLAPGEQRSLTLSLTLPSTFSADPRDYWSGYLVRAVPAGSPVTGTFGVGANVLAYETVGAPSRHVKLTALKITDEGPHAVKVSARLVNDGRNYVRSQIRVELEQAGRVVRAFDDSTPAIFAGEARQLTRTLSDLPPGLYRIQLTVDYGGDTLVQGTSDFRVR